MVDDLESSTALSEVSLVVEVTTTARRSTSTDLESDAVGRPGSPGAEKNTVVDMADDLASSVPVDDVIGQNFGMVATTPRDVNCQSTSLSAEPRHLTTTAADRALSLFIDENLGDVMSMGFVDDGSGGGSDRGWMPTAGMTGMDCLSGTTLGGRPSLLHLGGEVSEDASSDIDVELRRIVASVAHNHNNDDVISVTSDDCGGCGTPDVPTLPATVSLSPTQAATPPVAPSLFAVSPVDDQVLAALNSASSTSTTDGPSLLNHSSGCVSEACVSHAISSSCDGFSVGVDSNTLNVVDATGSGTPSNKTASVSRQTPSTSTTSSCLTGAAVEQGEQEMTGQEEPSQHIGRVERCDSRQSASCIVTENAAVSGCCQKSRPSDATTSTESCSVEVTDTDSSARSSSEVEHPVSDVQLLPDAVCPQELISRVQTVHENSSGVSVSASSVPALRSTEISTTLNSTSAGPAKSVSGSTLSVVQTSPSTSGCISQQSTARCSQQGIGSSRSVTSTSSSVSLCDRSSKNLECSPKKDSLSVNCTKASVDSHTTATKSPLPSSKPDVSGSSERGTQTNPDLLGRYFHRRREPIKSFVNGAKHSRGSGSSRREKSSRMLKSPLSSSSSSGSSAYHFGSTSSSSSAVSTTSPALAGGTVLLTSGAQVTPLIMPALGPLSGMNGKTTFLITVPANITLPASVGAVIGPAGTGGSVPVSLGPSKASVAAMSGSQLVARTGGSVGSGGRLTGAVSSTATALVLGQSALGAPLQLLVAAATALTTTTSPTVVLSRGSQSSLSKQPLQSAVVTVVTCSSMVTSFASGAQTSNYLQHNAAVTSKIVTPLVSHGDSTLGQPLMTHQNGLSVRVGKSPPSCSVATVGVTSATAPQVAMRAAASSPSTVVILPMTSTASPGSGGVLLAAIPSSTVAVSSPSLMMTTTMTATVPRCSSSSSSSSSSAVSPTTSGARHATIASLPRVAMRRRPGTSDEVIHSTTSSLLGHAAAAPVLNGLGHGHTPPTTVLAPSAVRHDGGGKSPVGGTTPTVVAKQPIHGEGAPSSIIRAILERNPSCPPNYNIDEALSGHHVAPPTPSPTDDHETLTAVDNYYANASAIQPSSTTIHQSNEEQRRISVESVLNRPASVCQMPSGATVHLYRDSQVLDDYTAARSERQTAVARKRTLPSAHHPTSAKYRRLTTDACTTAEQSSVRNINLETDLTQPTSGCSAPSECGSRSTAASTANSSAVGVYGLSLSVGSQQTGSSNGVSTAVCENGQRQQNEANSTSSSGRSSEVERTTPATSPLTRKALPKKVYAYFGSAGVGSAGGVRENAAAVAANSVAAVGDRSFQPVAAAHQNNSAAAGTATGRRAASDDGPINHLRLMCSGLAASAGGLELHTHSTA